MVPLTRAGTKARQRGSPSLPGRAGARRTPGPQPYPSPQNPRFCQVHSHGHLYWLLWQPLRLSPTGPNSHWHVLEGTLTGPNSGCREQGPRVRSVAVAPPTRLSAAAGPLCQPHPPAPGGQARQSRWPEQPGQDDLCLRRNPCEVSRARDAARTTPWHWGLGREQPGGRGWLAQCSSGFALSYLTFQYKDRQRNAQGMGRGCLVLCPPRPQGSLADSRGHGAWGVWRRISCCPKASLPSLCLQRDTGVAGEWGVTCCGSWVRLWGGGRAAWAQPTLGEHCRGPGLPGELQGVQVLLIGGVGP